MNTQIRFFILIGCVWMLPSQAARFNLNVDPTAKRLDTQVCFRQAPRYLRNQSNLTQAQNIQWDGPGQAWKSRGSIRLPHNEAGCLRFSQPLPQANGRLTSQQFRNQHPNSQISHVADWLWHHPDLPLPQLAIKHPSGIQVSAPWRQMAQESGHTVFQVRPTPRHSDGFVVLGPLQQKTISVDQAKINLSILPGRHADKQDDVVEWVETMTQAVAAVHGDFPVQEIQVIVIVMDGAGGAVPWGQVNRSGGQGVLFVINGRRSKSELFADWTAAHEFSHLLLPYTPTDRWLSEGFASYHQNISRLRAGLLDERTAWAKLVAGFERGRRAANAFNAPTLKNANMRHLMQMYWGGAVIALKADVALQRESNGRMTLSRALNQLQNCCLDTGESWQARSLFRELDRITSTDVFTRLYHDEVTAKPYPEYHEILKNLGIKTSRYGGVRIESEAPWAHIRERIGKPSPRL